LRYLSFLALLSPALVSTAEASSTQPVRHYLSDGELNPVPSTFGAQPRVALMQTPNEHTQAIHPQPYLSAPYNHELQPGFQSPIYAHPTSAAQFYDPRVPASLFTNLRTASRTVSTQQNRHPMSIYEHLRNEQEQVCNLAAAQEAQKQHRRLAAARTAQEEMQRLAAARAAQEWIQRLAAERAAQEEMQRLAAEQEAQKWIQRFLDSTKPREERAQPLEQRQSRSHQRTAHPYHAPAPSPSHIPEQPLRTQENANNTRAILPPKSSSVLPIRPIPTLPSTIHKVPKLSSFILTQQELFELAPAVVKAKVVTSSSTANHLDTQTTPLTPPLRTASVPHLTKPHDYERMLFVDGPDPRLNGTIIVNTFRFLLKKHFNPTPTHQMDPIYHSLVQERTHLREKANKDIMDHMKLSKLERGIPMVEHFGTPENFEFSAGILMSSLYDLRVLPSRRFAIHTLLTSPDHYGPMLGLHHRTQIKKFEDEVLSNTIFSLPRFFKETPIKAVTAEETISYPSPLRFRPYTMAEATGMNPETNSLIDFFKVLNFREIMGEETSAYRRAFSFNALMHERALPIIRAVALHFKANRILYELQTGKWHVNDFFSAETARHCLERAYHCLESLSYGEIADATLRQKKLAFKQTLLDEINEDANALRFLFTHD
jgi:flagellar biosynthesis GTPase FlhF